MVVRGQKGTYYTSVFDASKTDTMEKFVTRAITSLLVLILSGGFSLSAKEAAELNLQLLNPKGFSGKLFIALYQLPSPLNAEATWEQQAVFQEIHQDLLKDEKAKEIAIADLQQGQYAIRLFLDENQNQRLDISALGIPKEAVGFSNNPSLLAGMPTLAEANFEVLEPTHSLKIRLVKHKPKKKKGLKR